MVLDLLPAGSRQTGRCRRDPPLPLPPAPCPALLSLLPLPALPVTTPSNRHGGLVAIPIGLHPSRRGVSLPGLHGTHRACRSWAPCCRAGDGASESRLNRRRAPTSRRCARYPRRSCDAPVLFRAVSQCLARPPPPPPRHVAVALVPTGAQKTL